MEWHDIDKMDVDETLTEDLDIDVSVIRMVRDGLCSYLTVQILNSNTVLKCQVEIDYEAGVPSFQAGQRAILRVLSCNPPTVFVRILYVSPFQGPAQLPVPVCEYQGEGQHKQEACLEKFSDRTPKRMCFESM